MVLMRGELKRVAKRIYLGQFIKLEFSDVVGSILYEISSVNSILLGLEKQKETTIYWWHISSNCSTVEHTGILDFKPNPLLGGAMHVEYGVPIEWPAGAAVLLPKSQVRAWSTLWLARKRKGGFIVGQTWGFISLHVTWPRLVTPAHRQNQKMVHEHIFTTTVINSSYN